VYVYHQILHDWLDGRAISILKALIPVLNHGEYLPSVDDIQPEPKTLPNWVDRRIYAADPLMMAQHNARKRALVVWKSLLAEADRRFIFQKLASPSDAGA
jgi:hypothetical protein